MPAVTWIGLTALLLPIEILLLTNLSDVLSKTSSRMLWASLVWVYLSQLTATRGVSTWVMIVFVYDGELVVSVSVCHTAFRASLLVFVSAREWRRWVSQIFSAPLSLELPPEHGVPDSLFSSQSFTFGVSHRSPFVRFLFRAWKAWICHSVFRSSLFVCVSVRPWRMWNCQILIV